MNIISVGSALASSDFVVKPRSGNFCHIDGPAVQFPRLFVPEGIRVFETENKVSKYLHLMITDDTTLAFIKTMEDKVDPAGKNFASSLSKRTFKLKIDPMKTEVFDEEGTQIECDFVKNQFERCTVAVTARPTLVYYFGDRCGMTWNVERMHVWGETKELTRKAMDDFDFDM